MCDPPTNGFDAVLLRLLMKRFLLAIRMKSDEAIRYTRRLLMTVLRANFLSFEFKKRPLSMATHQKVSFREVDALYVEDISYTGW
jgi:hypothetical protein